MSCVLLIQEHGYLCAQVLTEYTFLRTFLRHSLPFSGMGIYFFKPSNCLLYLFCRPNSVSPWIQSVVIVSCLLFSTLPLINLVLNCFQVFVGRAILLSLLQGSLLLLPLFIYPLILVIYYWSPP
jgi:hypothetical protein